MLGLKLSSYISGKLGFLIGPFFRPKKIIETNILRALPDASPEKIKKIIKYMWSNYGRILSEYMFMKQFRESSLNSNITVVGQEILDQIKNNKEQVVFISGHFNNFELMAMQIEKSGINLAAIYRPLNNLFLNVIMEKIRKKYICKNQIKKGKTGIRELLSLFKNGHSIALMIDQRVSQGIKSEFFGKEAYTTTMPAQFIKKYNCKIIPLYIERFNGTHFKIKVHEPIKYEENTTSEKITKDLNSLLEKMILNNPEQWIWSHDRWK